MVLSQFNFLPVDNYALVITCFSIKILSIRDFPRFILLLHLLLETDTSCVSADDRTNRSNDIHLHTAFSQPLLLTQPHFGNHPILHKSYSLHPGPYFPFHFIDKHALYHRNIFHFQVMYTVVSHES